MRSRLAEGAPSRKCSRLTLLRQRCSGSQRFPAKHGKPNRPVHAHTSRNGSRRSTMGLVMTTPSRTQLLRPLIPQIAKSKRSPDIVALRVLIGLDFLVRDAAPLTLRGLGLWYYVERAQELEELPRIVDARTARHAFSAVESARMTTALNDRDVKGKRPVIAWVLGDILNTDLLETRTDKDFADKMGKEAARTYGFRLDVDRVMGVFSEAAGTPRPPVDRRKWWERLTLPAPGTGPGR